MAYFLPVLLVVVSVEIKLSAASTTGLESCKNIAGDCVTSLSTLEEYLYCKSGNRLNLNRYFFPPREEAVPYAKVMYHFDGGCSKNVTYLWAVGGFLLIQPPSIFVYTSLLFFHTRRRDFNLHLSLPQECVPLVNSQCSCESRDDNPLDVLSQQIHLYAQFNNPKSVQIGRDLQTQAICYEEWYKDYTGGTNIRVYITYTLCLPLMAIGVLLVVVRSMRAPIAKKLSNSLNHPNVAGLVLTGVFLHLFCLLMDALAIWKMIEDSELKENPSNSNPHHSLNFFVTGITFGFNLLVSVLLFLCLLYLHCWNISDQLAIFPRVFQRVYSPLFYVIFGEFDQKKFWGAVYNNNNDNNNNGNNDNNNNDNNDNNNDNNDNNDNNNNDNNDNGNNDNNNNNNDNNNNDNNDNDNNDNNNNNNDNNNNDNNDNNNNADGNAEQQPIIAENVEQYKREHLTWIVFITLLAPLFSFSSHFGYIWAAWLTEPHKATSVALIYLAVLTSMFLMLRQCYIANGGFSTQGRCRSCLILFYPFVQAFRCALNLVCLCIRKRHFQTGRAQAYERVVEDRREENLVFNTKALCLAFAWGWSFIGCFAFLFAAFYELPLASYALPLYLLNAFQVFIVIVTLLITYKVLKVTDPWFHVFLRSMGRAYLERARQKRVPPVQQGDNNDVVETAAALVGEATEVVIHELVRMEREN